MSDPNVSPDAIGAAPPEALGAPAGPVGPDPLTRDPRLAQKMGWVGQCFGHGDEKKGNLVGLSLGFAALLIIALLVAFLMMTDPDKRSFVQGLFTPVFGIFTGLIGYLIGTSTKQ